MCVGSTLDAVVEEDEEEDMCDFNARLACPRHASCLGCKVCQRPEEQDPCIAYDVHVGSSDVFAIIAPQRRILDRCAAKMIRLENDDNFMTCVRTCVCMHACVCVRLRAFVRACVRLCVRLCVRSSARFRACVRGSPSVWAHLSPGTLVPPRLIQPCAAK